MEYDFSNNILEKCSCLIFAMIIPHKNDDFYLPLVMFHFIFYVVITHKETLLMLVVAYAMYRQKINYWQQYGLKVTSQHAWMMCVRLSCVIKARCVAIHSSSSVIMCN